MPARPAVSVTVERGAAEPALASQAEELARAVALRLLHADRELLSVRVIPNNNRTRVLSWQRSMDRSELRLRVARTILGRPDDIAGVVLELDPGAWPRLQTLHNALREPKRAVSAPKGQVHDLEPLCHAARVYVPEVVGDVPLRWGRWPARASRRHIQLGACDGHSIRVHPALDHDSVPGWFLEVLLHHELLHLAIPPQVVGGRRVVHSRIFRHRERAHPLYDQGRAWERENLRALLLRTQRGAR